MQQPIQIIVEVQGGCVVDVRSTGSVPIVYDIIDHDVPDTEHCTQCGVPLGYDDGQPSICSTCAEA